MKITQLRGDLAAFRNLELSIVLNAMKTENSRKPVTTLRQNIPYLTPGIKSLAAEKIPVVLFGVTLKRDDERIGVATYAGLVLLSIGNLIDYGCHTGPGSGISADTRFVCRIERTER